MLSLCVDFGEIAKLVIAFVWLTPNIVISCSSLCLSLGQINHVITHIRCTCSLLFLSSTSSPLRLPDSLPPKQVSK